MDTLKRKQLHDEDFSHAVNRPGQIHSITPVDAQAHIDQMSSKPAEQLGYGQMTKLEQPVQIATGEPNQQAKQLDMVQTQPVQAQNNVDKEAKYFCDRESKHLNYEQSLKDGFETTEEIIARLQNTVADRDARISQMQVENEDLKRDVENVLQDNIWLENHMAELQTSEREFKTEVENLKQENQAKLDAIEVLETDIVNRNNEIRYLQAQVQHIEQDRDKLIAIINSDEHAAVEQERQQMQAEMETLLESNYALEQDNAAIRAEIQENSKASDENDNQILRLHQKDQQHEVGKQKLLEVIKTLGDNNTALEAENYELQAEIQDITTSDSQKLKELQEAGAENEEQYRACKQCIEGLSDDIVKLTSIIDNLSKKNKALEEDKARDHEVIETLCTKNTALVKDNFKLQPNIEGVSKANYGNDNQCQSCKKDLEQLAADKISLTNIIGTLSNKIAELEAEKFMLRAENRDLSKANEDCKKKVQDLRADGP